MKEYGLIGKTLQHSFSPRFFNNKFSVEKIDARYHALELLEIASFSELLQHRKIDGLNVTIPYKEQIIPFLDALDQSAAEIGAVNCIQMHKGQLKGFNTDIIGFTNSLQPLLKTHHRAALILGTGGASKAVQAGLKQLNIHFRLVSRSAAAPLTYDRLTAEDMDQHQIIINTTPLGMHPNTETLPDIPYQFVNTEHLLYDLVYNPEWSAFLTAGQARGASIKNGQEMLELQALAAWAIWNE